ncbi:hypothetical protein [Fulvivirga lutimaris]|uniref:hypothetical protein n=1 Tax=Fulvivirga lutimaris TaxID=1819566 RepID=UPI001C86A7C6|nr:hypothetical protein [Fulvivirga lutimaris]
MVVYSQSFGQTEIKKLPPNINHPSLNLYTPVISGDGETIVYQSDYSDDGFHTMYFTTKKSVSSWNDGVEVSKNVNRPTLNYYGGYSLSFEGDMLIFTSRKSGLGGFELWYSKREGDNWGAPKNFGGPINSASNEGTASLSVDGETMYFMRCNQMSEYKGASGCKLMVATMKYGKWQEPVELPANINTGNSQNPKILADGNTLIFSSDQFGGKGGLDLFMTKKLGDSWSEPVPMDFINTPQNDQFISIPSKGRYLYTSMKDDRVFHITQVLIPEEFQPKKVMRVQGTVTDKQTGEPLNAMLTVFNIDLRDRIFNEKIGGKGEFSLVMNEGSHYDLSLKSDDQTYMYYSKIYALDEIGNRDKQNLRIQLEPMSAGSEYETAIRFKEYSSEIDDLSTFELRRLADLTRRNSNMKFELDIYQNNYKEDSVFSDEDLTELIVDSVYTEKEVIDTISVANTISKVDSLGLSGQQVDSLLTEMNEAQQKDSIVYTTVKELEIKKTYHNDRTEEQAEAVKAYLVERGANPDNIKIRRFKNVGDPNKRGDQPEDVVVILKILSL